MIRACIGISLCLISLPAVASEKRVNQFIDIALGNEYRDQTSHLRRWHDPIRVKLHQKVSLNSTLLTLVDEHLTLLERATNHPIKRVDTQSNVDVYLVKHQALAQTWQRYANGQLPSDALCAAQITTDQSDQITRAVVMIPVDRASQQGRLLSCLVEELTQITGLVNDSVDVYPSIFNDLSTDQMITSLDWAFLRTLYHPSLQAGMAEARVRQISRDLLSDSNVVPLLNEGKVIIAQSNLFQLLSVD